MTDLRTLALLTVRNEGAFLLEWLAHHRACGFTNFLVFSNDCTDGTDLMLDRLAQMGWLTHVRNDGPHAQGPQWAALKAAETHPLVLAADWVLVCDIDEFVNIHVGNRTLAALFAALPQARAIALTWRMFGNAGVVQYDDAPVTQTFLRAAPPVLFWPWRAQMFKTLYRRDAFRKPGVHRPKGTSDGWFDGSGRAMGTGPTRIISALGQDNGTLVQLNHYALGAMESYLVKCDRGRANREASAFDLGYWVDRNFSTVEDRTILSLDSAPHRQTLRDDPVLGALHDAAVAWRKARFADLMRNEDWRALFGRLLMAPPTRLLTPAQARLVWQHGAQG